MHTCMPGKDADMQVGLVSSQRLWKTTLDMLAFAL